MFLFLKNPVVLSIERWMRSSLKFTRLTLGKTSYKKYKPHFILVILNSFQQHIDLPPQVSRRDELSPRTKRHQALPPQFEFLNLC